MLSSDFNISSALFKYSKNCLHIYIFLFITLFAINLIIPLLICARLDAIDFTSWAGVFISQRLPALPQTIKENPASLLSLSSRVPFAFTYYATHFSSRILFVIFLTKDLQWFKHSHSRNWTLSAECPSQYLPTDYPCCVSVFVTDSLYLLILYLLVFVYCCKLKIFNRCLRRKSKRLNWAINKNKIGWD